jgi:hypothetical protein
MAFDVALANELEGSLRAHVRRAGGHLQCRTDSRVHKISYYCLAKGCTFSVVLDISPRPNGFGNVSQIFLEHSCLLEPKAIPPDLSKAMSFFVSCSCRTSRLPSLTFDSQPFLTYPPVIYQGEKNPTPKREAPEIVSSLSFVSVSLSDPPLPAALRRGGHRILGRYALAGGRGRSSSYSGTSAFSSVFL